MQSRLSELGNEELSMFAMKKKYGQGMEDEFDDLRASVNRKNSYEDSVDANKDNSILDVSTAHHYSPNHEPEKESGTINNGKQQQLLEKVKREERALQRYEAALNEWDNVAKNLSKKIGKKETDLIMATSCAEFRTRREEAELLDNSVPSHVKFGPLQWEMSLRGDQES